MCLCPYDCLLIFTFLQVVPGYYLRRDTNGQIENSAAVNNTASEHFMVDRLIVDDLLNWAVNYKVSFHGNNITTIDILSLIHYDTIFKTFLKDTICDVISATSRRSSCIHDSVLFL
jgi:hypothetical protein